MSLILQRCLLAIALGTIVAIFPTRSGAQVAEPAPQQFVISLELLEISHTALHAAGVKHYEGAADKPRSVLPESNLDIPEGRIDGESYQVGSYKLHLHVDDKDDALLKCLASLKKRKLAKVLAEPTLVIASGRPAQFRVGGEYPTKVSQSPGADSTNLRRDGTQVDAIVTERDDGRIRLDMHARFGFSAPSRDIVINGKTVPGLDVHEFAFATVMKPAQTLIVGGIGRQRVEEKAVNATAGKPAKKVRSTNILELVVVARVEKVDAQAPATAKRPAPAPAPLAPK